MTHGGVASLLQCWRQLLTIHAGAASALTSLPLLGCVAACSLGMVSPLALGPNMSLAVLACSCSGTGAPWTQVHSGVTLVC